MLSDALCQRNIMQNRNWMNRFWEPPDYLMIPRFAAWMEQPRIWHWPFGILANMSPEKSDLNLMDSLRQ